MEVLKRPLKLTLYKPSKQILNKPVDFNMAADHFLVFQVHLEDKLVCGLGTPSESHDSIQTRLKEHGKPLRVMTATFSAKDKKIELNVIPQLDKFDYTPALMQALLDCGYDAKVRQHFSNVASIDNKTRIPDVVVPLGTPKEFIARIASKWLK